MLKDIPTLVSMYIWTVHIHILAEQFQVSSMFPCSRLQCFFVEQSSETAKLACAATQDFKNHEITNEMVLTKTNYIPIYHYLRKLDFSQLKSGDSGCLPLPTHDLGRGNQLPTTWPMSLDQSFYAVPKSQLPTNSARSSEIICAKWDPPWTVNTW